MQCMSKKNVKDHEIEGISHSEIKSLTEIMRIKENEGKRSENGNKKIKCEIDVYKLVARTCVLSNFQLYSVQYTQFI